MKTLFIGDGGWLTCSNAECPEPVVSASLQALKEHWDNTVSALEPNDWKCLQDIALTMARHYPIRSDGCYQTLKTLVQQMEAAIRYAGVTGRDQTMMLHSFTSLITVVLKREGLIGGIPIT